MIILNEAQEKIINAAIYWFNNSSELIFQYTGAAGTGKSIVLNEIIKRLQLNEDEILPMSFTGTAALVMRSKGLRTAKTIHSSIYEIYETFKLDMNGNVEIDPYFNKPKIIKKFRKKDKLDGIKLLLIDEASMTPKKMLKDLTSFGIKIIACGDLNQLPPVGDEPGFLVDGKVFVLDKIMRQAEESGIIYLANRAIRGLPINYGVYNDAYVIEKSQLNNRLLIESDIVLTCKNNTRDKLNKYLRTMHFGNPSILPYNGEPVICRKNNWNISSNGINLVNGLRGTVYNYPDVSSCKNNLFFIDLAINNGEEIFKDIECDYNYFKSPIETRNILRNSPYSKGNKFELAYAITTHLSQGSQYEKGIFIEEFLNRSIMNNLLYTGITRFSKTLIFVKQSRKYY